MDSNIVTTTEISLFFGVSERIVQKWVQLGCPVLIRGGAGRGDATKLDSVAVVRWVIDRRIARATRDRPDAALKRIQAQLAELDLCERQNKLIAVADVEPVWAAAILAARAELLGLGARLKSLLDSRYGINVDQQMIDDIVFSALQKLSESAPADPENEGDGGAEEAHEADLFESDGLTESDDYAEPPIVDG
ncbi:MAG: terminase small subunit [Gallionella sp.]|nr:terminase small subunit [Gallionella sp.]